MDATSILAIVSVLAFLLIVVAIVVRFTGGIQVMARIPFVRMAIRANNKPSESLGNLELQRAKSARDMNLQSRGDFSGEDLDAGRDLDVKSGDFTPKK